MWGSVNYCTMGSEATDAVVHLEEEEFTEGTSCPKITMSQPPTCRQLMTCLKQLKAHFLPCTLDLSPCSYLLTQPSARQAPQCPWRRLEGIVPWDKAERQPGEAEFSDLISVMWIAVILSWPNLHPAQVAWEEEATAAREPLLAAQPRAPWMQLRICLRRI